MRKMFSSGKYWCRVWFRLRAEARSRPKGFSTITRAFVAQPASASFCADGREHAGRDGQVVGGPLRARELRLEPGERRGVVVVAVHVAEAVAEPRRRPPRRRPPPCSVTLARARSRNCSRVQPDLRHADHREVERARGGPWPGARGRSSCRRGRRWPRRRRARRSGGFVLPSLLLHVAAEAEAHGGEHLVLEEVLAARGEALEERGGEHVRGHALVVGGRPPSSALRRSRRPCRRTSSRPGSAARACAVRSSSQEVTTLPRRQSSVMSARLKSYW